jgi:large subunit ribosomal protein L22
MSKPAAPRKVGEKEALAVGAMIRGSSRKLNLVAGLIRGRKVEEALNILKFSPKAMSEDVYKVLASAVANAENNHNLDVDALVVSEASVGKSITMKRFATRARGRSTRIEKPFSRLRVVVREQEEA